MKRALLIFTALSSLLCCSSCWDYTEVNMQDYAFGISIDKANDEYTVCIETLKVSGSPENAGSQGVVLKTTGENLFDAIRSAITHAGKKLYWGHFSLAIIGESAAPDIMDMLDVLSRAQDVYLNVDLLLARGVTAEQVINAKLPRETSVTDHITEIFDNRKPSRHFIPTQMWQVYRDISFSDTFTLPTVTLNSDGVPEVSGSAVFNSGKLTGFLSGEETLIFSLLSGNSSGGYIPSVQVTPELQVSLEISRNTCRTRAYLENGKPAIFIKNEVMLSLSRSSANFDAMDPKTCAMIGKAAQSELDARISALLKRIQNGELGDPLLWRHRIEADIPKSELLGTDMNNIISTLPIHLDLRASLNSAGMTKRTITFK